MKELHGQVRQDYRQILLDPQNSVLTGDADSRTVSASVGNTPEELALVPGEANMGLGRGLSVGEYIMSSTITARKPVTNLHRI